MTSLPYVVPFGAVIALLAVRPYLPLSPLAEQAVWILVMVAILALVARPVLDFRVRNWGGSLLVGVAVFAIWIGPDRILPGYHSYWLFSNSITGSVAGSLYRIKCDRLQSSPSTSPSYYLNTIANRKIAC